MLRSGLENWIIFTQSRCVSCPRSGSLSVGPRLAGGSVLPDSFVQRWVLGKVDLRRKKMTCRL